MVDQQAEEKRLVAVVQRSQIDVLLEIARLAAEVLEHAPQLLFLRRDVRRQAGRAGASVSRSASVNAVPLLSAGSCSSAMPFGSAEAAFAHLHRHDFSATSLVLLAVRSSCAAVGLAGCARRLSVCLRNHLDRAARAFGHADAAALAVVEIELEPLARPQLDHRVVGAHAVTVVALEAVAAGQAAARFEQRVGLRRAR